MNGNPKVAVCGAKKKESRGGGPCQRPAGAGTDHPGIGTCMHHGGRTPAANKSAAKARATSLMVAMAGAVDVTPEEALLETVRIQCGMVDWVRGQVANLTNDEAVGRLVDDDGRLVMLGAHHLVRLRGEEEDRLVKLIKTCHDIGIDERRIRLVEQAGEQLAEFARGLLTEFGLLEDPRAPEVVRRLMLQLSSVDGSLA